MKADTVIRHEGMNTLIKNLGLIEAERFIMLIQNSHNKQTPPFHRFPSPW
jgi:hypothetical protein